MKKHVLLVFYLCVMGSAYGEFQTDITGTNTLNDVNLDAGQNNPTIPTAESVQTNGLEGAVLNNVVFSQDGPVENTNIGNQDVSDKFGEPGAAGSAGAGMAAAIATGASLMAAGVPMAASIIPSVRAAGIALIAKAGLEFAQAAASGAARQANKNIETRKLRFNDDNPEQLQASQAGSSLANARRQVADQIASQINTPELQQLLTNNGVNSDSFINDLASGNLTDFGSVANGLGDLTDFSDADLVKGDSLASSKLGDELQAARIEIDEDNDDFAADLNSGGGALVLGGEGELGQVDVGGLPKVNEGGNGVGLASVGQGRGLASGADGGVSNASLGGLLGKLKKRAKRAKSALAGFTIEQLHNLGLVKLRRGMNIFQKAHRSYKSFNRWRVRTRLARHP